MCWSSWLLDSSRLVVDSGSPMRSSAIYARPKCDFRPRPEHPGKILDVSYEALDGRMSAAFTLPNFRYLSHIH
jgi:hypothetical protein